MKDEITCFMLYYGRKDVAEESMESFLRQTYPHKKLIIINDHPDPVWFEKEYLNVEVHNIMPGTFKSVNEKYAYALNQVKTKWWAPWDSDDIWLPWHLENLAAHIPKTAVNEYPRKIGISRCYFMFFDKKIMIGWQMWSSCIWETFNKEGKLHAKCDLNDLTNCDRQIIFQDWDRYWIDMRDIETRERNGISLIFRWHPKRTHNKSAVLGKEGQDRAKKLNKDLSEVRIKEPWRPHWDMDYVEKAKGEHETYNGLQSVGLQA
jgi:glycosyltransferase involved in cell wall biosynthesis